MRRLILVVIVVTGAAVAPVTGQNVQVNRLYELAYSEIYCECPPGGCPGSCLWPNASLVVTPFGATTGPSDSLPAWSPDGARVAYLSAGDVMVMDAAGTNAANLTNSTAAEGGPTWSPDGQRIAFVSNRQGGPALYLMNPDGSNVIRMTTQVGVGWTRPSWSPDNSRLAFTCEVASGNQDICVLDTVGAGLVRLTADPAIDDGAAWSPDGAAIVFSTTRYGGDPQLATMNADGSNALQLGNGIVGWDAAWSPDGRSLAFTSWGSEALAVYTMRADGSEISSGMDFRVEPAWMTGNALVARMSVQCTGLVCSFSAAGSSGLATSYAWTFGDGATASGVTASHTYAVGGTYAYTVTLSGDSTATVTASDSLFINRPPVAAFTVACDGISCVFDWSASHDPDGSDVGVNWDFGDGGDSWWPVEGVPTSGRHMYPGPGTYTAAIRVADPYFVVAISSKTITVTRGSMHAGDLDIASVSQKNVWSATTTITMHDSAHRPLANAVVSASWNGGSAVSCTTNAAGDCYLTKSKIPREATVRLTVLGASHPSYVYGAADNHDPDGSSNGTTITISRQ